MTSSYPQKNISLANLCKDKKINLEYKYQSIRGCASDTFHILNLNLHYKEQSYELLGYIWKNTCWNTAKEKKESIITKPNGKKSFGELFVRSCDRILMNFGKMYLGMCDVDAEVAKQFTYRIFLHLIDGGTDTDLYGEWWKIDPALWETLCILNIFDEVFDGDNKDCKDYLRTHMEKYNKKEKKSALSASAESFEPLKKQSKKKRTIKRIMEIMLRVKKSNYNLMRIVKRCRKTERMNIL